MPMQSISAYCDGTRERVTFWVDQHPDSCPSCHNGISPLWRYGWIEGDSAYAVFQCPINDCRQFFISYFQKDEPASISSGMDMFNFTGSGPRKAEKHDFPEQIKAISGEFCKIYDESYEAEQRGLRNICGAGYRRALEFLIKDYLIKEKKCDQETIKKKYLSNCIADHIDDKNLRECATRAAWLGNDETHYYRIWQDKDVTDLKALIGLTVNLIHNDCLTRKFLSEMPKDKSKGRN